MKNQKKIKKIQIDITEEQLRYFPDSHNLKVLADKINEIIDYLNEKSKENWKLVERKGKEMRI